MLRILAGTLLLAGLVACGGGTEPAGQPDLTGIWLPDNTRAEPWPASLPLTPEAKAMMDAYLPEQHDPTLFCMPFGTPRNMLQTEYPLEIVHTADRILMIVQPNLANSEVRRIPMDAGAPGQDIEPSWFGTSRGRWDGKTVVIETRGMRPDAPVSGTGIRHSGQLHIVERLTIENDRERGRVLVNDMELTDPEVFTTPVRVRRYFVFAPQAQPREPGNCIELQWIDKIWRQRLEEHAGSGA